MKLKDILSPGFQKAFSNLLDGNISGLKPHVIYKLKKLNARFQDESKTFESMRLAWCEELAEKDESGKAILEKNVYKISMENQALLQKKIDESLEIEINPLKKKIDFRDIETVKLSVKDLIVLECIIEDPEQTE